MLAASLVQSNSRSHFARLPTPATGQQCYFSLLPRTISFAASYTAINLDLLLAERKSIG